MVQLSLKPMPVAIIVASLVLFAGYRYGILRHFGGHETKNPPNSEPQPSGSKGEDSTTRTATENNILDFFDIPDRDGMKIKWSHRTNSKALLDAVLNDDSILMLEADVRLNNNKVPVMAHEETDVATSDMNLKEWLAKVGSSTKKGIKLDIKTTVALEPTLQTLKSSEGFLKVPIWINGDVLPGPNTKSARVDAKTFFEKTHSIFPHCTLSAGWVTDYKQDGSNEFYTQEMIDEMHTYTKTSNNFITFPVRASLAGKSIDPLRSLLKKSDKYSLTLWHSGEEDLAIENLLAVRKSFDHSKVVYDLPDKVMQDFNNALM